MDKDLILAVGPYFAAFVSLVVSILSMVRQGTKDKIEAPRTEAETTKLISEASKEITQQYSELLDRVKDDFQNKLKEMQNEIDSLKKESSMKDEIIAQLKEENKNLNQKIADLENWKLASGI